MARDDALLKYYNQRHRLFHRFADGIVLDDESWYSVTPEKIARHHAERIVSALPRGRDSLIVDAFCGSGGNAIQFALALARGSGGGGGVVIGVDWSAERVAAAAGNAGVYDVENGIEFLVGDSYRLLPVLGKSRVVDAVFLSPPWGGPEYVREDEFDAEPFVALVRLAKEVTENVAIMLPRNLSEESVSELFGPCEFERNYLGGVLKTVTLYFGCLVGLAES